MEDTPTTEFKLSDYVTASKVLGYALMGASFVIMLAVTFILPVSYLDDNTIAACAIWVLLGVAVHILLSKNFYNYTPLAANDKNWRSSLALNEQQVRIFRFAIADVIMMISLAAGFAFSLGAVSVYVGALVSVTLLYNHIRMTDSYFELLDEKMNANGTNYPIAAELKGNTTH